MEQGNQLQSLKERVFARKTKGKRTDLTDIMDLTRSFSCLGEIIGREFEVYDPNGKLLYKIRQRPIAVKVLNRLLKEFDVLLHLDAEAEKAKWGQDKPGSKRLGK